MENELDGFEDAADNIDQIDINEEMRNSYLDYAMSVIVARALPDARDGLKPVHRRILYAMHDMGLHFNRPHRKSARIVGEVLGKYHPHGDSAVYDSMVRMAQDFSLRYMQVDGQGNFGSIDGDRAAAMRYTEARLSPIAAELLADLDKNTIDFEDNFDGQEQQPVVLPARLPNLLLNGTSGIAVGMATNIPPHNLREVIDATVYLIDHQDSAENVTLDDLMQFIKGPDFPTGAQIIGIEGIKAAYATGRGRVIMRAKCEIVEAKNGRQRIIITEIPYQVNKSNLIQLMAELVNKGVINDIADLRDESGRAGLRITVDLKRGTQPKAVLNQLFKHTPLQSTFGVQMLALVDRQPRLLSLKRALQVYIDHRVEVTNRRIQFELDKALARQHILEGLRIALANLDAIIATIRGSDSADHARGQLVSNFGLSEIQAQAILDMQLRRLAALERQRIEDEYLSITSQIDEYRDLLANAHKILAIIREELLGIKEKFGDDRRSELMPGESDFDIEDLIQDEDVLISLTQRGYIKRTPASEYRLQARGGKGLIGMATREEDSLENVFAAGSKNHILFFTNLGKVYVLKAYRVPEASRTARGTSVMNILPLMPEEKVTATLPVASFDESESQFVTLITRHARIKRVSMSAFDSVRSTGIIAIGLDAGDELRWVKVTNGDQDLVLISEQGQGIRFNEEDVRPMGRTAAGVNAMKLSEGDRLAGADVATGDDDVLVVTQMGFGKRTPLENYRRQNRYGSGVRALVLRHKDDRIIGSRVVQSGDELTCISTNGIMLRTAIDTISSQGRSTQGVRVMDMNDGDTVASLAVIRPGLYTNDEEEAEEGTDGASTEANAEATEGDAPAAELATEAAGETPPAAPPETDE